MTDEKIELLLLTLESVNIDISDLITGDVALCKDAVEQLIQIQNKIRETLLETKGEGQP